MFLGNRMAKVLEVVRRYPDGLMFEAVVRTLGTRPGDAVERKAWAEAASRLTVAGLIERRAGIGASAVYSPCDQPPALPARRSHPRPPGWR